MENRDWVVGGLRQVMKDADLTSGLDSGGDDRILKQLSADHLRARKGKQDTSRPDGPHGFRIQSCIPPNRLVTCIAMLGERLRRPLGLVAELLQQGEDIELFAAQRVTQGYGLEQQGLQLARLLALRARGLGSVLTTLHLGAEQEAAKLLGLPDNVLQVALLPVAYTKGTDFKRAERPPVSTITHYNGW